jgi:hypothetical protein
MNRAQRHPILSCTLKKPLGMLSTSLGQCTAGANVGIRALGITSDAAAYIRATLETTSTC